MEIPQRGSSPHLSTKLEAHMNEPFERELTDHKRAILRSASDTIRGRLAADRRMQNSR